MKKHILPKFIALGLAAALLAGGVLMLPQTATAEDDFTTPGRLLGAGQNAGDGSDSSLTGPPGSLDTGRYTSGLRSNSSDKSTGLIHGDGFSLNLVKPQTHGHDDDIGARAGWNWEF